jgi:hypothetical protein
MIAIAARSAPRGSALISDNPHGAVGRQPQPRSAGSREQVQALVMTRGTGLVDGDVGAARAAPEASHVFADV